MFDAAALGSELAELCKGYVAEATAGMAAEIDRLKGVVATLEARQPQRGDPGPAFPESAVKAMVDAAVKALPEPTPGKDAEPVTPEQIAEQVRAYIEAHPPEPGEPGKSVEISEVERLVSEAVARIPPPINGKDADPVSDDRIAEQVRAWLADNPPQPGAPGKDAELPAIERMIAEAVAAIPAPADGKSVTLDDVAPMIEAAVQKAVSAIPVAKDGVGMAGAVIDRDDNLIVTMTDGTVRELGRVVGKDADPTEVARMVREAVDAIPRPKDGENGRDGFALEDFDSEVRDGGRTLVLSFTAGEIKHTVEHQLDTMIFRGVFQDGGTYQPGDTCQFGGGIWHCDRETQEKPADGCKDWTLAVRRGRPGTNVTIDEVQPLIDGKMQEVEAVLVKRLDMALARRNV